MASLLGTEVIKLILDDPDKLVEGWDSNGSVVFYVPAPYMKAVRDYITDQPRSLVYVVRELP
jgi:hypothetical protein